MNMKKSLACIMSIAFIGGCVTGIISTGQKKILNYNKVLATGIVPYEMDVTIRNPNFVIDRGGSITVDMLKTNGIKITEFIGHIHDMADDPLYGQLVKTKITRSISPEQCDFIFPADYKEGKNTIQIINSTDINHKLIKDITVNVIFSDTVKDSSCTVPEEPITDTFKTTSEKKPYYQTFGDITFDFTDSIVRPGETTYVDINISEHPGFKEISPKLVLDNDVFSVKSISTTDYCFNFKYNISKKSLSFSMQNRSGTTGSESNVLRIALEVKEDAPEGNYEINLKGCGPIACTLPDGSLGEYSPVFHAGTVTVSRSLEPKTNVSDMPLEGRVYAGFQASPDSPIFQTGVTTVTGVTSITGDNVISIPVCKTGDTTGDGKINALDAAKMIHFFVGSSENINNADIDENGKVNTVDLIQLKNYITLK